MEIFSLAAVVGDGPFTHAVHKITSSDGSEIDLSVFTPTGDAAAKNTQGKRPLIYFIHPGGLILNTQFVGASVPLSLAKDIGAVVISVDYRLAPKHKAPPPSRTLMQALSGLPAMPQNLASTM
ncbi:hypothetical protein ACO1O0_006823 [Amphichorda felina]